MNMHQATNLETLKGKKQKVKNREQIGTKDKFITWVYQDSEDKHTYIHEKPKRGRQKGLP